MIKKIITINGLMWVTLGQVIMTFIIISWFAGKYINVDIWWMIHLDRWLHDTALGQMLLCNAVVASTALCWGLMKTIIVTIKTRENKEEGG